MKAVGIIRNLDPLGRISIPIEICRSLNIKGRQAHVDGTPVDIYHRENEIVLQVATEDTKGSIRNVDNLNRVTIPIEMSRKLNISKGKDGLEFFMDNEKIVMRKYEPGCTFCGSLEETIDYSGRKVCRECIRNLRKKFA